MDANGSATTSKPFVNGEASKSQTLNHVTSYPLVKDLLHFYQDNSLGAKSIEAFDSLYQTFAKPVEPYLQTPYSIAYPYLQKVDSIGDSSLSHIDGHIPALKSTNFESLRDGAVSVVYYPIDVAGNARDYLITTYRDESKKVGGAGAFAFVQKVFSTELRIAADIMHAVAEYIEPKKDALEKKYDQAKKEGSEKARRVKKTAHQKVDEVAPANST